MSDKRDLLILGGGLVGMTLALTAAKQGLSVHVVDRADPSDLTAEGFDGRASAISTASWNLFGNIGIADRLEPFGCPIASIAVTDGMKPGRIDFQPEEQDGSLGRMFPNRQLRMALYQAAEGVEAINFLPKSDVEVRHRGEHGVSATLADGSTLQAALMVGAEGRMSPTREEAGITMAHWDYSHRAMIVGLTHSKPHGDVAWEIFYPAGPFALLPLLDDEQGRHRSALVWTVAEKDAAGVLAMPREMFTAEVAKRTHGVLGDLELQGEVSSYPLSFQHTVDITGHRLALVGDAAHGMHPIAGQGLNLGLRDVGTLVEVLQEGMRLGLEPGDAQLLERYQKWRALDSLMVMGATDGLTRLFGVPGKLPSAIRRFGMGMVQRTPPLKRWFMDEARGISGEVPQLLKG